MATSSAANTPKRNLSTPLRLTKRHQFLAPPETPDCYAKVTVETPGPSKTRNSNKVKSDQVRNLTVAVRVRPMNTRELSYVGAVNLIQVQDQTIVVDSTLTGAAVTKTNYLFPYDHVFWSCDETSPNFASQEDVFIGIGEPLLNNAFWGYNACLFAYGQTGSGKSYSMMGPDEANVDCDASAGIIPRFCEALFAKISQLDSTSTATVDVSYFEIYNEKIHDLLSQQSNNQRTPLKVREHPVWGPYVVNLSTHTVKSYSEMRSWLLLGNKNRVTAATVMNEKSSRSHSIFSIELSLSHGTNMEDSVKRSKVSLVDLAGSERLGNTNNNEKQLKQGVCINKSLLTLGKVISALADQKKGSQFVPYRDSVLTWLLRESLGGNSLTAMLATITPANTHIDETLATLRYACQARSIINRARVNEDPHDRLIRELKSEIERLQALRHEYENNSFLMSSLLSDNSTEYLQEVEELRSKLGEKEEELQRAQHRWENRYKETQLHQMQQLAEVEKEKEELQSRVRIMSKLNDEDVALSPYRSNFLEEVENILTENHSNSADLIEHFELWLRDSGYDYQVTLNECGTFLNILDEANSQNARCSLNQVRAVIRGGDLIKFVNSLKWEHLDVKLTESLINSVMKDVYGSAKLLQPHINKEEKLRLAFARFIKSAQVLESSLCNSINVSNSKKTVTFRL